ncbi:hypothetical protein [Vitiosangium sp. GDMCC 1.1324]|uniref:hypothetical protein n=1 Tax=Vitiosangium sp. (strain GDMCC 1.1324) TaxID=2138576 RepID=UPI000D39D17C|nr:hypothetical protein [Vitiosangium sp. GDMCC 1.1324]PTL85617.1 hypothetical protein DAT35_02575 [Vitiosangium sp. GDMCC 1.1324]
MSFKARKLEFVDALHIGGISGAMCHEVRHKRPRPIIREDDTVGIRVSLVTRLDGEIAAEFRRKVAFDTGEGVGMFQEAEFLSEGDGLIIGGLETHDPFALGVIWKLAILESRVAAPLLVGLVDIRMSLRHALHENGFEAVELRSGESTLESE